MWWLKVLLSVSLCAIVYQDFKDKAVSFYWFPMLAIFGGVLHYTNTVGELFLMHSGINLGFVSLILMLLWLYVKIRKRHSFFKAFGSGDLLMFYALSFSMASVTFIVCFVFSMLFALILSFVLSNKNEIPLAGYMAVFFLIIYIAHWSGWITQIYSI